MALLWANCTSRSWSTDGRLIQHLQARPDKNSNDLLLNLLNALPFNDTSPFDAQLVFKSIIMEIPVDDGWDQMSGYTWKEVCNKLIKWDATYAMPLLDALFTEMGKEYRLSYGSYVGTLANELARLDTSGAWGLLVKHFEATLPKWRTDLLDWLKGGLMRFDEEETYSPIADLPMKEILLWIEQDIENRNADEISSEPGFLLDFNMKLPDGLKMNWTILTRVLRPQKLKRNEIVLVNN